MAIEKRTQLSEVMKAIEEWMEEYPSVVFIGSFFAFDENFEVVEDRMIGYGSKDALEISMEALSEALEKEEEEFVNW